MRTATILWVVALLITTAAGVAAQNLLVVDDAAGTPGRIWRVSPGTAPQMTYEAAYDNISSLSSGSATRLLFSVTAFSEKGKIFELDRGRERVVYQFKGDWVRDIAFDSHGSLYFSTSSGGASDGMIYRLPADPAAGEVPKPFFEVRLSEVGGHWSGHFAFSPPGGGRACSSSCRG